MPFLEKLTEDLVIDEGIRLKPYNDNATPPRLTIGIGRNLTDKGISRGEAYHLFHNDLDDVFGGLDHYLSWWRALNEQRQVVLANMAFNLGVVKLLTFTTTLALVRTGKYPEAARNMLKSLWAKQVGPRANRLADLIDPTGAYKKE